MKRSPAEPFMLAATLTGHTAPVLSVSLSADGHTLASGSEDGTIQVWDLLTGQLFQTLPAPADTLRALAFDDNKKTLISGSEDGMITIWDLATAEEQQTFITSSGGLRTLALSRDGRTLVSGEADGRLMVWQRV